jgi:hypothetical protein
MIKESQLRLNISGEGLIKPELSRDIEANPGLEEGGDDVCRRLF